MTIYADYIISCSVSAYKILGEPAGMKYFSSNLKIIAIEYVISSLTVIKKALIT